MTKIVSDLRGAARCVHTSSQRSYRIARYGFICIIFVSFRTIQRERIAIIRRTSTGRGNTYHRISYAYAARHVFTEICDGAVVFLRPERYPED